MTTARATRYPAAVWPLPALLAWATAWGIFLAGQATFPGALVWALAGASAWGALLSLLGRTWWRRAMIGLGFPLSLALSGMVSLPGWAWLIPLALLALVYPVHAWRDAPVFPTPAGALQPLAAHMVLPPGAQVLDAGCGLGHGLRALRQAFPAARLYGIEWSWPLRLACAWRCRWASVRRGDIWRASWAPFDLVYLFQRPETMARAAAKAQSDMRPGTWLVSLEFDVPGWPAQARLHTPDGRALWVYQLRGALQP